MLAAETEAAIDGADEERFQQSAIGVAMHNARQRRIGFVANRIGIFMPCGIKLSRVRDHLEPNGVVWISIRRAKASGTAIA
jgi:hypothetical protein